MCGFLSQVAEWELNACFVAVSNFLQFACSNQELSEDVAEKVILGGKNQVFTYQVLNSLPDCTIVW